MTSVDWLLDGLLALVLPVVAWRVVTAPTLEKAVVLFIALGLLSALAWVQLDAVDVALVEAAVGSGLTGALLMSALSWAETRKVRSRWTLSRAGGHIALAGLVILLGWTGLHLPYTSDGLTHAVVANAERTGAHHPVTAVLLDFRGYDTLIEVAVLLVAAIAIRQVQPACAQRGNAASDLLTAFVNILVPVCMLTAGYLVWEGSHAPGGAFQAGAILAGSGVVLLVTGRGPALRRSFPTHASLVLGLGVFVGLAAAPLLGGGSLLEYPHAWAGTLLLGLELALTISIAVALVSFFPASPHDRRVESPAAGGDAA